MAEPTKDDVRRELRDQRAAIQVLARAAFEAGDKDEVARLTATLEEIDALLDKLALAALSDLAGRLSTLQKSIEKHRKAAKKASGGVGGSLGLGGKKDAQALGAKPAGGGSPAGSAADAEPAPHVSEPQVRAAEPAPGGGAAPVAPDPGIASDGRLFLTEAHLIALWRRSQFPIPADRITVFGLRGCRPIMVSGTGFEPQHEIVMTSINYETMNCTIGQWRPGHGLALFPGSTVPFGSSVKSKIREGGEGVNQMGRGRYLNYFAGWHKRTEGSAGHWALIQDCAITIQRTADNAIYDERDRWEVGKVAGDNIHCAFFMGQGDRIPDIQYSSLGCQVVAGTLKKGVPGSERGPWRRFMEPFGKTPGGQKAAEYVLLGGDEAQQAIRTQFEGRTIILRMGSFGPWVSQLQAALVPHSGAVIDVDGDFGPWTFQAVLDFQSKVFGPDADDGLVGPETAAELGITLPTFDFEDAIAGGNGCALPDGSFAERLPTAAAEVGAPPPVVSPGDAISWGGFVTKLHGVAFKHKVVEIARRLSCDPNHLMAVMAFETGASFRPDKKNAAGSGAIGLIQFIPPTAKGLGTTTEKLAVMSAFDQLDFVEKHFRSIVGSRPLPTLEDVYMVVLLPVAVGKPDSFPLFKAPSTAYRQNAGLDVNKDGLITKAEAAKKVHDMLLKGMATERIG